MTIEFSCPECGKPLSTSDDKAGRSAKCPGCSAPITVPGRTAPAAEQDLDDSRPDGGGSAGAFPEEGGGSEAVRQPCPVCGELIPAHAKVCRYCGERFAETVPAGPAGLRADFGVIWEKSWEIYKNNVGICVALGLIASMVNFAAQLPQNALNFANGQGNIDPLVLGLGVPAAMVLANGVQFWLAAGYTRCMLKLARGDVPEISELFSGGRWFWRTVGGGIVFSLAVGLGTLACIIPGIIAALRLWPYLYFIVDDDDGVIDGLNRSFNLTTNQSSLGLLLGLSYIGLGLAGVMMCCVGVLFTTPLASLLAAMTYLALRADYRRNLSDGAPDGPIA
jgi:DNA-directed RNA polymerase subunit RPC12/RpoP